MADRVPEAARANPPAPRRHVRGAEREELAVGVDRLARPRGERAAGQRDIRVGDEGDRDGRSEQRLEVGERDRGERHRRQAAGHSAHEVDAEAVEAEGEHGEARDDDGDQGPGGARPDTLEPDEAGHDGQRQREHDRADRREAVGELDDLAEVRRRRDRHAREGAQLAEDHHDPEPGHVPEQDGPREHVRDKPEPEEPGRDAGKSDEDRERCRQGHPARRVTAGQRRDRRGHHDRRAGLWADRQQARRPEERVQHHRDDGHPERGERRRPDDAGVREALRNDVGGDGDARQHVGAEPCGVVASELDVPRRRLRDCPA